MSLGAIFRSLWVPFAAHRVDPSRKHRGSDGDVAYSLANRLERVKDTHRRDIESLILQKDDLIQEINELRSSKALFIEETTNLNRQHTLYTLQNSEAQRQLESTREALAKLRTNTDQRYTTSTNGPFPSRPTLGSSRSPALSPIPPELDGEILRRTELEPVLTAKKFKWGKGKEASTRQGLVTTTQVGAPVGNTGHLGVAAAPSPSVRSNTSLDSASTGGATRLHSFQQTSILRPVKCDFCGDKMWGLNEVRCTRKLVPQFPFSQSCLATDRLYRHPSVWLLCTLQVLCVSCCLGLLGPSAFARSGGRPPG